MSTKAIRLSQHLFFLSVFLVMSIFIAYSNSSVSSFSMSAISSANELKTGEWLPAQTTVSLQQNGKKYSRDEAVVSYIEEAGEQYQVTLADDFGQFLSFSYKLQSQETAPLFDMPAAVVYLNKTPVLQIVRTTNNDSWHTAFIDLSTLNLSAGVYDLSFVTQNSYDALFNPKLEIKEVTTTKLFLTTGSQLEFETSKQVSAVFVSYYAFEDQELGLFQEKLAATSNNPESPGRNYQFVIPENFSSAQLSFWSVDTFNNTEPETTVYLDLEQELQITQMKTDTYSETDAELHVYVEYLNLGNEAIFFQAFTTKDPVLNPAVFEELIPLSEKIHTLFYKDSAYQLHPSEDKIAHNLVFKHEVEADKYFSLQLCTMYSFCETIIENQAIN